MEKLVKTGNGRKVKLTNENTIKVVADEGKIVTLIEKPTFEETTNEIKIGYNTNYCSRDFGHFIGMYIGDGWVDKSANTKIHIATIHTNMVNFYRDSVNKYLRQNVDKINGYHKKNTPHAYWMEYESTHGKFSIDIPLYARLDMMDFFGHGAKNKTFPDYFLNTPEEFRWGMLSGLIDTDGSISYQERTYIKKDGSTSIKKNKDARYSTISEDLASKIQLLAFSLGINATLKPSLHKKTNITEYIILFSTKHLTEKRDKLSLLHEENIEAINKFTISNRAYYKDIIPFDREIFDAIKKYNRRTPEHKLQRFRNACKSGYIARENFLDFYREETKELYDMKYDINKDYESIKERVA